MTAGLMMLLLCGSADQIIVQTPLNAAETAGQRQLDQLAWMAGTWRDDSRPGWTTEEMWLAPRRGTLLGLSREVFDQRTREFEYMRVAVDHDGGLGFYASLNGNEAVRFDVTEASATQLVVTNPAHDYPQRIVYQRQGNRLTATISLMDGSRARSWTYALVPR
jgi:hypothetical protein